jgi:hypothetical protein
MKRLSLLVLSVLFAFAGLNAQDVVNLAYFPFTGTEAAPNTPTSFLASSGTQVGTAGLYLDGTHGSSAWLQDSELTSNGGTTTNALNGEAAGQDLSTINSSANGKSIVFHFSTVGFQQVEITMACRRSAKGFNSTVWSYSTDGLNFTVLEGVSTVPTEAGNYEMQSVDLSGINAINSQANVYVKCTYDGAQTSNGSFRIDNVQINAYPEGEDEWAPYITSMNVENANTLKLHFNEELDATTAENGNNYVMEGRTFTAALSGTTVSLTPTPALTEGESYTLIVSNVADANGNVMLPDTFNFSFGIDPEFHVATIAELRAKWPYPLNPNDTTFGHTVYKLNGHAIITGVNNSYRHQVFIQDATGAIVIDDPDNKMNSALIAGDEVAEIYGTLTDYYGLLQFAIKEPYTAEALSVYNDVTPLTVTLSQLQDVDYMNDHQCELLHMNEVIINPIAAANFENGKKYTLTQNGGTGNGLWIHIYNIPEITGQPIPTYPVNITGPNKISYSEYYIIPREGSDITTGIPQYLTENDIVVYPNPVSDKLNVTLKTNEFQVTSIALYDISGKFVLSQPIYDNQISVNARQLSAGSYFLRLSDGKRSITTKFVKQ